MASLRRRPVHSSAPFPILSLPPELVREIADHLDAVYIEILSMTCRKLRITLTPALSTKLSNFDWTRLQKLLERDPNIGSKEFFCTRCLELHPFYTGEGRPPRVKDASGRKRPVYLTAERRLYAGFAPPCDDVPKFQMPGFTLDFRSARLVMIRHLYGAPYGIPLEQLNAATKLNNDFSREVNWNQTWRTKIIQDELFLYARHAICHTGTNEALFRDFVSKNVPQSLCVHTNRQRNFLRKANAWNPSFTSGHITRLRDGTWDVCTNLQESCPLCLTDYAIFIERTKCKTQTLHWSITLDVCYQVGPCRSHEQWEWLALTGQTSRPGGKFRQEENHPRGSVRRKLIQGWNQEQPSNQSMLAKGHRRAVDDNVKGESSIREAHSPDCSLSRTLFPPLCFILWRLLLFLSTDQEVEVHLFLEIAVTGVLAGVVALLLE